MKVELRGNRVTVYDGPQTKRHSFATHEEALDFAAKQEDERLARQKHMLALLVKYSDPAHPADPVLPRPGELRRAVAEILNAENPDDDPIPLPSIEEPTEEDGVLRDEALAILAELRAGGVLDFSGHADPPGAAEERQWQVLAGLVDFEFSHSRDEERLKVVIKSRAAVPVEIERTVTDVLGVFVREGQATLDAGRVLTRHYDLAAGQLIRFWVGAVEVASYKAENDTPPGRVG